MKKLLSFAFAFIFFGQLSACDICGCGAGSNYIGILPEFSRHIFGIRYRYNALQTHLGAGGSLTYLTSREVYRTTEIWTGWNIGQKFRVLATLPYSFDERKNQGVKNTKNGLGDVSVAGYYELVNSRHNTGKKLLVQSLWVGAGIKLPTGQYKPADKSGGGENANLFQLGTASTDFSFNAMYDVRLQDAGVNVAATYKLNTENKYQYDYGNKASVNMQAYYKWRIKDKLLLAPNAGVLYEHSQQDIDNKFRVDISGGNILSGTVGLEAGFKKISVGANCQKALTQNFAKGIVRAGNRTMLHVAFVL